MSSGPSAPESLGPYRLLEKLGHGGMAMVYRGERAGDAGFRKKVAIKRMLPQFRRDASLLERFAAEARTNARLDHPNLVQVIDFGIDPEPFLVLELVDGVTLGSIMQRLGARGDRLDIAAACYIGAEAASGLDHAHRKKDDDGTPLGIVHRDVSPQNILVSHEGAVKVSDFGLVKAADNVLKTMTGVTIGKMSYMAPEQADGRDVDARADVFSLGVILWEMLTLRPLIPANDAQAAANALREGKFPPPSRFNDEVPPELDAVVLGCLKVDPEARTPSAQQVSQDLREILHARAGGYGQHQLARLVQWLFPERGWELPEPERPVAQPSPDERASIVPFTPAAVAVARAAEPRPEPARTAREPAQEQGTRPSVPTAPAPVRAGWSAALVLASFIIVGAGASVGAVLTAFLLWQVLGTRGAAAGPPDRGVRFESDTPQIRLYLGATELGPPPIVLLPSDLTGEPMVALAPLHQPSVIRAERLVELARSEGRVHRIELTPSRRPDIMVYVRYDGQGEARMPAGEGLGSVPGVVRVPTRRNQPDPIEIVVIDEHDPRPRTLPLSGCGPDHVCVLEAQGSGR